MGAHHRWTADEDEVLLSVKRREAVARLPHVTPNAIDYRRHLLRAGKVGPGGRPPRKVRAGTLTPAQKAAIRAAPADVTNRDLADRFGVTHQAVALARGPTRPPPRPWAKAEDRLVKALPVAAAAARTGRAKAAVRRRRKELGLGAAPRPWTAAEDRLVRRLPAAAAAERSGRTRSAVHHRRRALGVAGLRRWTPAEDELVRTLGVDEAAERTGRTRPAVIARRRTLGVARRYKARR